MKRESKHKQICMNYTRGEMLFTRVTKRKNPKGYYKHGNLLLKDTKSGTMLLSQANIYDPDLIKYLYELDASCNGELKIYQMLGMLASLAFQAGIRLENEEPKRGDSDD